MLRRVRTALRWSILLYLLSLTAGTLEARAQQADPAAAGSRRPHAAQTSKDAPQIAACSCTPPASAPAAAPPAPQASPLSPPQQPVAPAQSRHRARIVGVVQGRAAAGQRVRITVENYNPQQDALWVNYGKADPSLITGPDTNAQTDYDGSISFIVPADWNNAARFNDCPREYASETKPRVRIGVAGATCPPVGERTGASLDLVSRPTLWQQRGTGVALSLAAVAAIILLLAWLTGWHLGWARQRQWIIDDETRTYSLQRIQFLGWTAAAVFAYLYVFYSLYFAQGVTEFPVLPVSLIKLLGISAGTSLLAHGVNQLKGPEGSGSNAPNLRDLITSGDVIALDKVQLLVWTLVGWFTFLLAIGSQEPGNLSQKIPELPDALWQLAGLSGIIYIGGKAVRGPGPVLRQVHATWQNGAQGADKTVLHLELRGLNLSQDGTLSLCMPGATFQKIPFNRISGDDQSGLPKITVPGDTAANRLVRGLSLEVNLMPEDPLARIASLDGATMLLIRIENPDGQLAECDFRIGAPL